MRIEQLPLGMQVATSTATLSTTTLTTTSLSTTSGTASSSPVDAARRPARRRARRDGAAATSGQLALDLPTSDAHAVDERPLAKVVPFAPRARARAAQNAAKSAEEWFERACDLEERDPAAAVEAYARALALDPGHAGALLNVGRLHHSIGSFAAAEAAYRDALAVDEVRGLAAFNLGVLLEDQGREDEAVAAYEDACAARPPCVDAHFNVARLYERAGDRQAALRHLIAYRRLSR